MFLVASNIFNIADLAAPTSSCSEYVTFYSLTLSRDNTIMTADQVEKIIHFLPTPRESKLLQEYMAMNPTAGLCECEKFMVAMMTVKKPALKMRTLLFKLQFPERHANLSHREY